MNVPTGEIFLLKDSDIKAALHKDYRQYFIGELSRPQILDHIEQGDLEVGTSLYADPTADVPHMHSKSSEILYILEGTYHVFDINADKKYTLSKGDFFVIPPNTPYASKADSNTQVLFIKTGGNDKVEVDIPENVKKWLEPAKE